MGFKLGKVACRVAWFWVRVVGEKREEETVRCETARRIRCVGPRGFWGFGPRDMDLKLWVFEHRRTCFDHVRRKNCGLAGPDKIRTDMSA